jgi:hypothetical protein
LTSVSKKAVETVVFPTEEKTTEKYESRVTYMNNDNDHCGCKSTSGKVLYVVDGVFVKRIENNKQRVESVLLLFVRTPRMTLKIINCLIH